MISTVFTRLRFSAFAAVLVATSTFATPTPSHASIPMRENTHLIDADNGGFAIYRTSKPNKAKHMRNLCAAGITEIMVLDGTGSIDEAMAAKYCPGLKVIYNVEQSTKAPLDNEFLKLFDAWVQDAKATGKKIAFRCNCGCHRTGRLAAYYQMKYQGMTSEQAIDVMYDHGKFMFLFSYLRAQVRSLEDFIQGRECSQKQKRCVVIRSRETDDGLFDYADAR